MQEKYFLPVNITYPQEVCRWREEHENNPKKNHNKVMYLAESHLSTKEEYEKIDTEFVCGSGVVNTWTL